jgi:ribonuclease VapC
MWRFLQVENDFEIIPFDETQAREALSAFHRYGEIVCVSKAYGCYRL